MALIRRRRAAADRLRVHVAGEQSWRTELPAGTLARRFAASLEGAAELRWSMTGQLAAGELLPAWPAAAPRPFAVYLLAAQGRVGAALDAEYPAGDDPVALGTTLREALLGIERVADAPPPSPVVVVAVPDPGPFAAAGGVVDDDDRRLRAEDLAWLNPGDLLRSERRGRLRIKRVEDDARQVLARAEDGELLALGFDELVGEFCFED